MPQRSWQVKIGDKIHSVSINIGNWNGKHTVKVDKKVVSRWRPGWSHPAVREHHFDVAGKPALLVCTNVLAGVGMWTYELFVDGSRI